MYQRKGFTVVELLVVVGIIVILAGITFAAMGPSRESARQTVCMTQLKQIYGALSLYTADWPGVTYPNTQMAHVPTSLALRPYVNSEGIWYCPDYTKSKSRIWSSYLFAFISDVWTQPLSPGDAEFLKRLETKGEETAAALCLDHDFSYYAPRERSIAYPFAEAFVIELRFNGSTWKGRSGKRISDFR